MLENIFIKHYNAPKINRKEIFRYALIKGEIESKYEKILDELLSITLDKLTYKVCYGFFPVDIVGDEIDFGFSKVKSNDLVKNLSCSKKVIIFASTIGIEIDRLINKYGKIEPTKALFLQAIGTERIETLCDVFQNDIKKEAQKEGLFVAPRFSPGYGDLSLSFQRDIFNILPLEKIMLTLNDSLLMSPSKSVTAIIGLRENANFDNNNGCKNCKKIECEFRR